MSDTWMSRAASITAPSNHARSGDDGALGQLDAARLDRHWAVNARSYILLAQSFAAQHDGRQGGSVVFMTSGQHLGPLPGEAAYGAATAAVAGITLTLADAWLTTDEAR